MVPCEASRGAPSDPSHVTQAAPATLAHAATKEGKPSAARRANRCGIAIVLVTCAVAATSRQSWRPEDPPGSDWGQEAGKGTRQRTKADSGRVSGY